MLAVPLCLLSSLVFGGFTAGGRRRTLAELADSDAQICDVIEAYIDEKYLDEILRTLQEGGMQDLETMIADDVAHWCMRNSEESARRRSLHQDDLRRVELLSWQANETKIEHGSVEYVELVKDRFESYQGGRRRSESDVPEIAADMWMQCAGYAVGTAKVIAHLHQHGAADIVAANLRGNAEERVEACGAIVNSVNAHLRQNEIPGMTVVPEENGSEMVVVTDDSLLTRLQSLLGPLALTLAGSLALQFGTFQFYICNSYRALDIFNDLSL